MGLTGEDAAMQEALLLRHAPKTQKRPVKAFFDANRLEKTAGSGCCQNLLRDFQARRNINDGNRGVDGEGFVEKVAFGGGLRQLSNSAVNGQGRGLVGLFHVVSPPVFKEYKQIGLDGGAGFKSRGR